MHNINIFYVAGMYGSTVDYILQYAQDKNLERSVLPDGSMHAHIKSCHVVDSNALAKLKQLRQNACQTGDITYPWSNAKFKDIVAMVNCQNHKNILIHADTLEDCEITLLNQYYKIAYGATKLNGLQIFEDISSSDFKQWNKNYTSWQDMQRWEWREWFSITYPDYTHEWIASQAEASDIFLKISLGDLIYDTVHSATKILKHCNFPVQSHVVEFASHWKQTQEHILHKRNLVEQIVVSILEDQHLVWKPISIIEEAMIQNKLRNHGFEIACTGLNEFPCTTDDLKKVLYTK